MTSHPFKSSSGSPRKRRLNFTSQHRSTLEVTPLYGCPSFPTDSDEEYASVTYHSTRLLLPMTLGRQNLSVIWWKHCRNHCRVHQLQRKQQGVRRNKTVWDDCCDNCYSIRGVQEKNKTALSLSMMEVDAMGNFTVVARHPRTVQLVDRCGNSVHSMQQSKSAVYLKICDRRDPGGPFHWMYFKLKWTRTSDSSESDSDCTTNHANLTTQRRSHPDYSSQQEKMPAADRNSSFLNGDSKSKRLRPSDEDSSDSESDVKFQVHGRPTTAHTLVSDGPVVVSKLVTPCHKEPKVRSLESTSVGNVADRAAILDTSNLYLNESNGSNDSLLTQPRPQQYQTTEESTKSPIRLLDFDHSQQNENDAFESMETSQTSTVLHLPLQAGEDTQMMTLSMEEATQPQWKLPATEERQVANVMTTYCRTMSLRDWENESKLSIPGSYRYLLINLILCKNNASTKSDLHDEVGGGEERAPTLWLPEIVGDDCTL